MHSHLMIRLLGKFNKLLNISNFLLSYDNIIIIHHPKYFVKNTSHNLTFEI
jgi:hypothetical protein